MWYQWAALPVPSSVALVSLGLSMAPGCGLVCSWFPGQGGCGGAGRAHSSVPSPEQSMFGYQGLLFRKLLFSWRADCVL